MDKKTKTQLMITLALVPLLGFLWFRAFYRPRVAPNPVAAPSPAPAFKPLVVEKVNPDLEKKIAVFESIPWGRNPFLRKGQTPGAKTGEANKTPSFKLEGIVWDDRNPYAIIDGEVRGLGDLVANEYMVIEIEGNKVTLRKGNQLVDLQLFQDNEFR